MKNLFKKTFKEIYFEFSMMVTFSTGVTAFYHCVLNIINHFTPHFEKHGLVYLCLTSFCILIPSIIEAIKTRKPNIFIKMITGFVDRMLNIIGFTTMLVPTVLLINKMFGFVHILGDFKIMGIILSYSLTLIIFFIRTYLFHRKD